MKKSSAQLEDVVAFSTPERKSNDLFSSKYIPHSHFSQDNPEAYHTFFHDNPLEKFYNDISRLRPVAYHSPDKAYLDRNYIVLEQKVTYGKALTPEEFEQLRLKKKIEPEIVTYGLTTEVREKLNAGLPPRQTMEVSTEKDETGMCWCCAPATSKDSKALVEHYE